MFFSSTASRVKCVVTQLSKTPLNNIKQSRSFFNKTRMNSGNKASQFSLLKGSLRGRNNVAFFSTSKKILSEATKKDVVSKGLLSSAQGKSRFFKTKVLVGVMASIFLFDTTINDEWDFYLAKFKPKLSEEQRAKRPHIVVIGSGWAALNMIRLIEADKFNITLVSPKNYFLFTPLLCSTASGLLETRSIIEPIREYLNRSDAANVSFYEAEAHSIDPKTKTVKCTNYLNDAKYDFDVNYDYLVVAAGAEPNTFNIPGVKENAFFMKTAHDGSQLKNRLIDLLETAHCIKKKQQQDGKKDGDEEYKKLLRVVLVGGGPTSVELASEVHDFITKDVRKNYPDLENDVRITLVEALPRILSMFDASLIRFTEDKFKRDSIDIWTKSKVVSVTSDKVKIELNDSKEIVQLDYGTLIWCSGVGKVGVVGKLMQAIGRDNGQSCPRALVVDSHMRVIGADDIFAIGDCAFYNNLPPTAQVAAQQGKFLARSFNKLNGIMASDKSNISADNLAFRPALSNLREFSYLHKGSFAYIGGHQAIADFSQAVPADTRLPSMMQGMTAYFLWRSVYFSKLLSYQNRFLVASNWVMSFFYGRDICKTE